MNDVFFGTNTQPCSQEEIKKKRDVNSIENHTFMHFPKWKHTLGIVEANLNAVSWINDEI